MRECLVFKRMIPHVRGLNTSWNATERMFPMCNILVSIFLVTHHENQIFFFKKKKKYACCNKEINVCLLIK